MSRGALLMILSSFVFSLAYVFVKKVSLALGFWEAAFFRSLFGTFIISGFLLSRGSSPFGRRANRGRLALRGFLGATAMVLYFLAFQKTTMANASALHFTHPLFTTLLAVPLLKERVTFPKFVLVLLALLGVGFVFRPDRGVLSVGALAGLLSGLFASLAYLSVRALSSREEKGAIINALTLAGLVITLPFTLLRFTAPSPILWLYIFLVAALTTLAQFLMTSAYKLEEASSVAGYSFVAIIWAILFGKVIFAELPSLSESLGIGVIFLSMVGLALLRRRATREG